MFQMNPGIPVIAFAVIFGALFIFLCRKPHRYIKDATKQSIDAASENTKAIVANTAALREHTEILRQYLSAKSAESK